jgi:polar amino acid transport system permease protein
MSMVLGIFLDQPRAPAPRWVRIVTAMALFLAFSFVSWTLLAGSLPNGKSVWNYRQAFWNGWLLTIGLSAVSLVLSTIIGLLAALAKRSNILIIRYLSIGYIESIRGLPFLVLLILLYYVVANALRVDDRMLVGVIALSLFSGAYIAEMIRSGIESVGASQWESARAIGLTTPQTYLHVVFPQALKHALPPLAGQFASLIKDSSLLSILGIAEFTYTAQQINSATFSTLESFLPLGVGYLVLTLPISIGTKFLEQKFRYET